MAEFIKKAGKTDTTQNNEVTRNPDHLIIFLDCSILQAFSD